jgi:carboxy-terminal domain RNA polymerase II polypeptide A small phosphatase
MKDKLLILDVDETLIHTELNEYDCDFTMKFDDGDEYTYSTIKRPYLDQFLKYAFDNFQVGIFTTAKFVYVEKIMQNLGVDMSSFKFIFDREYCNTKFNNQTRERYLIKSLDRVRRTIDFPLEKMLIVDDKPETASENYGNLIQIKPFFYDKNDTELLKLMSYLETIKDAENFRNIEKRGWSNNQKVI